MRFPTIRAPVSTSVNENANSTPWSRVIGKLKCVNNVKPSVLAMGCRKSVTHHGCSTVLFLILLDIPDTTVPQNCHFSPASLAGCVSPFWVFLPLLSTQHGPIMVGAWISAFSRALHLVLLLPAPIHTPSVNPCQGASPPWEGR